MWKIRRGWGVWRNFQNSQGSPFSAWFYGLLIVTAASFISPLAILTVPLLSKSLYDRCMTLLVALGVGAMSGSCFFILIPQGFNITELENINYLTKSWL